MVLVPEIRLLDLVALVLATSMYAISRSCGRGGGRGEEGRGGGGEEGGRGSEREGGGG